MAGAAFTVFKLNPDNSEKLHYPATVLARTATSVSLRAQWTRADYVLDYVTFAQGDELLEHFYSDRWYNVFELFAADGRFKGWYCNITRPAVLTADSVRAADLALDVWVSPDRQVLVLDEDEYDMLGLSVAERRAVAEALAELKRLIAAEIEPFGKRH